MKRLFILLIFCLVANQAAAYSVISKGGEVACLKKEWYRDAQKFISSQDKDSFKAYMTSKKCLFLKKGLRVTITDFPGLSGDTMEFVVKGVKLWTSRFAFDLSRKN